MLRAPRQTAPLLHTSIASKSARSGSSRRIASTNTLCKNAAQTKPNAPELFVGAHCTAPQSASFLRIPHQPQQFRGHNRKLRPRDHFLRVNDDVPSCRYLLAMTAHDLSHTPPDAIADYCAAQRLLDAEAEAAFRQLVRAKENSEVGIRAAFTRAIHSIKFSPPHQPRCAGKLQTLRLTRA